MLIIFLLCLYVYVHVKVMYSYELRGPSGQSLAGLCSILQLGVSPHPWMGCLSIAGLPPALNLLIPSCKPEWREPLRE